MANTSIRVDTIGLGIAFSLGETYRVAIDEGFLEQEGGLQIPLKGNASIMSFSTPANPPQIANTIPTHTSTAPINIQNISFTIDRSEGNLTILGGNVFLNRQGSPNIVVKTFAVSNASVSGNTVAFSVIGNLEASQTYFITSNANIFLDRDGFKNNAISNSSSFRFVSPTAPTVTAFTPANASIATTNFTNVAINFDRTIFSNSGNLFLHNANTNAVVRTYNISSALISNNKVTLDVVGNIDANGYYYIKSNANVVMDVTQIKYPGLTNASTFTFKAPTSPFLVSTVPTNATTSASRSLTTASFTLDRTVTAVSGNVYLYEISSPNVLLKTWTIGSNVSFNSDKTFTVTVPQGMLAPTQAYYVTTDANIAKDLTYINFPGISTTGNVFTFTTDVAPLLSTFSPTYMEAIDETNNTISFTMDRLVNKNVGNIYLYKTDIVNGNALVHTYNINSNTTLTSNTTISANVANKLLVMEKYYVTSDYDILSDYFTGEKFRGIINANTFVFTTAVDREYYANEFRILFPTNVPQITDANSASTYSITITMADNVGHIQQLNEDFQTPAGWNAGTKTYTITGTKNSCNAILANLYYFPNKTVTSNTTLTYSQTKDSVLQKTLSFILFGRTSVVDFLTGDNNTYSIAEDSKFNFMPFYIYPQWDANVVVMLKSVDPSTGNVVTSAGTFNANTATGWTSPNDGVIYKSFSQPANISIYNSQLAEVRDIYYWLASDYTANVKIDALLGIESTVSGNTLSGGTVYSGSNNYTITPSGEYNLLTSGTYLEDGSVYINLTITDADLHPSLTYNVQMQQISPDPGLVTGAFTSPGVGTRSWGSISDTQTKSTWSNVTYYPPADYTGSILIGATITKIQPGQANVTLASNVAINLTNSATHNEYMVLTSTYGEGLSTIDYDILDQDTNSPTYYVTLNQTSPNPSTTPANIIVDSVDYGTTWSMSGSKSSIVSLSKGFYVYPDYTGNVVFGLTQIKSSYNGNITQASNVAVTFTNNGSIPAEFSLTASGTYIEDTNKNIDFTITDTDSRFNNYYINVRQISPDPSANVANIILGSSYGSNVTIYANRATINSLTKTITPPADWTSDIVLGYTQIKSTSLGNITQANNVAITYTNISQSDEVSIPTLSNIASTNSNIIIANITNPIGSLVSVYGNLQLALFGNGANNSTSIVDTSNNNHTITNTGGVRYSSNVAKWNGTSLYFNGSSSLSVTTTANLQMPNDFTWEAWVYPTISSTRAIISHGAWGRFMLFTNGYWEVASGVGSFLATGTITPAGTNAWTHFAVTRTQGRLRVFRNGTMAANVSISGTPESVNNLNIGFYAGLYFTGYMEDIFYFKDFARYTSNFTPAQFTVPTYTYIQLIDAAVNKSYNVKLSIGNNYGNIYAGNVLQGNSYTISGNLSTINNVLASNIALQPGYSDQTLILNYLQTQTSDNIIQANVDIPYTIYSLPAPPTIGTASLLSNIVGNVSATISYTPPFNSSVVNYYTAISTPDDRIGTATSGNIIVGNLTPGVSYTFNVNAVGAYGNSLYSETSNSLIIYTPPAAPIIGTASIISNSIATISYTAPGYTGGRTINSYTAISNPGNITAYVNQSTSGNIIVNGLQSNTAYTFTVYASHIDGNSVSSSASNSITTFIDGNVLAVRNVNVAAISNTSIRVDWIPPLTNNTVSSYTITANSGNITSTVLAPNTSSIITGLTSDQTYTFDIYATHSYGNSISVTSAPVTANILNSSGYFNGNTTSYLDTTIPRFLGVVSNGGSNYAYTVECWVYTTDTGDATRRTIWDSPDDPGPGSSPTLSLALYGNDSYSIYFGSTRHDAGNVRINNQWQHIAVTSYPVFTGLQFSHTFKIYVDGVQTLSFSDVYTYFADSVNLRIGGVVPNEFNTYMFQGYIDEFRVSNIARYTGNFTPSTTPFVTDANTFLLLHFAGANNSNVVVDSSNSIVGGRQILNSNVTISNTTYKM